MVDLQRKLAENHHLADKLAELEAAVKDADKKLADADYPAAIGAYTRAVAMGQRLKETGDQLLREEAKALGAKVMALRARLQPYEAADPKLAERIIGVDVALGLARTSSEQLDFKDAVTHFQRAQTAADEVWAHVEATYTPKLNANFTLDKTAAPFVWIDALGGWVAKFETTNGQYRRFKPSHNSGKQEGFSMNGDRQPVVEVTYLDAVAYCEWLNAVAGNQFPEGYRFTLPGREQWLTVVEAGSERLYPWGNQWPPPWGNYGNQEIFPTEWQLDGYLTDVFPVTCDVEKSGENEWGIAGLGGNVWEWSTEQKDNTRAVLGGSWTSNTRAVLVCRPKGNVFAPMDQPFDNIGFRVFILKTGK